MFSILTLQSANCNGNTQWHNAEFAIALRRTSAHTWTTIIIDTATTIIIVIIIWLAILLSS